MDSIRRILEVKVAKSAVKEKCEGGQERLSSEVMLLSLHGSDVGALSFLF